VRLHHDLDVRRRVRLVLRVAGGHDGTAWPAARKPATCLRTLGVLIREGLSCGLNWGDEAGPQRSSGK
jgi:hypothetical protein